MVCYTCAVSEWVEMYGTGYSKKLMRTGYKKDCSGFVSFVKGLGPGLDTNSLIEMGVEIEEGKLMKGDLIVCPGKHVALILQKKGIRARITELANHRGARGLVHRWIELPYPDVEEYGRYLPWVYLRVK